MTLDAPEGATGLPDGYTVIRFAINPDDDQFRVFVPAGSSNGFYRLEVKQR